MEMEMMMNMEIKMKKEMKMKMEMVCTHFMTKNDKKSYMYLVMLNRI